MEERKKKHPTFPLTYFFFHLPGNHTQNQQREIKIEIEMKRSWNEKDNP